MQDDINRDKDQLQIMWDLIIKLGEGLLNNDNYWMPKLRRKNGQREIRNNDQILYQQT
jgi:hypothetical protein